MSASQSATQLAATCDPLRDENGAPSTIAELVERVRADDLRYVFVGERHGVGPVKRFAVDLANALMTAGLDVGLYVEGFRTDCGVARSDCRNIATSFNPVAFHELVAESLAQVHAIDPPVRRDRSRSMAASVQAGSEPVRVVLVGDNHVRHAGTPNAALWMFGGAVPFPDPGDVVEAFPRRQSLTIAYEPVAAPDADETDQGAADRPAPEPDPYRLRADGCVADYVVSTVAAPDYWAGGR